MPKYFGVVENGVSVSKGEIERRPSTTVVPKGITGSLDRAPPIRPSNPSIRAKCRVNQIRTESAQKRSSSTD